LSISYRSDLEKLKNNAINNFSSDMIKKNILKRIFNEFMCIYKKCKEKIDNYVGNINCEIISMHSIMIEISKLSNN